MHFHFNDLLLIPAALPPVLWLQRQLTLRVNDAFPSATEITLHFLVWSVICEVIGPHFLPRAVGDPLDVLAYAVGGVIAWGWWKQESVTDISDISTA